MQINTENSGVCKALLSGSRPSKLKSEYITLIPKSPQHSLPFSCYWQKENWDALRLLVSDVFPNS